MLLFFLQSILLHLYIRLRVLAEDFFAVFYFEYVKYASFSCYCFWFSKWFKKRLWISNYFPTLIDHELYAVFSHHSDWAFVNHINTLGNISPPIYWVVLSPFHSRNLLHYRPNKLRILVFSKHLDRFYQATELVIQQFFFETARQFIEKFFLVLTGVKLIVIVLKKLLNVLEYLVIQARSNAVVVKRFQFIVKIFSVFLCFCNLRCNRADEQGVKADAIGHPEKTKNELFDRPCRHVPVPHCCNRLQGPVHRLNILPKWTVVDYTLSKNPSRWWEIVKHSRKEPKTSY